MAHALGGRSRSGSEGTRATCEALQAELRDLRATVKAMPSEMHSSTARMVTTSGASLGDALPDAVRAAAERHVERMLTTRATPTTEATS
jgi:hypothetical protein